MRYAEKEGFPEEEKKYSDGCCSAGNATVRASRRIPEEEKQGRRESVCVCVRVSVHHWVYKGVDGEKEKKGDDENDTHKGKEWIPRVSVHRERQQQQQRKTTAIVKA